jgi:ATP-dependent DNA helicase RecQ
LEPPQTWNASVAAQKALSCVHRTGQRFGVNYLIDVLLGKDDERMRRFGHDKVSTFGIGKDLDANTWRSVYRQLIAHGLLAVDIEGHGGLHLTEACRAVLRGEHAVWLRRDIKPVKTKTEKLKAERKARTLFDDPNAQRLWDALRARRRQLAEQQGVPPYVVFHDATLAAMVEQRPQSMHELSYISGVGARKLEAYGPYFLEILRA